MKTTSQGQLIRSLVIPVFLMTLLLLPLLFILIKRHFSYDLIPFSIINSLIITGGMLLNVFVIRQLWGKIRIPAAYLLLLISSAGFAGSGMIYIILNDPLFFLYGMEVLVSYVLILFILITTLSLLSNSFIRYHQMAEEEREKRQLEIKLREEMERQIYASKINPHFLFNSLNLMVSLLDDKNKAEEVLIQLSQLLRYTLDASKMNSIPLPQELRNVKKYLFIQKERFGDRLDYEITGRSKVEIPPLLLQPLIENSIKHNLDEKDYIKINILIEEKDHQLKLTIWDSEALVKHEMIGKGTGLNITKRRVELAQGIFSIKRGGIEICLPIK